ncbi:MAG: hypothetical protein FH756_17120 [Firmicutes bacterium]|nr:hypothetical protein [Bacillota bacterium]
MDSIVHSLGLNATIIAQIFNFLILIVLLGLPFLLVIAGFIYGVVTISDLKKRVRKLDDAVNELKNERCHKTETEKTKPPL